MTEQVIARLIAASLLITLLFTFVSTKFGDYSLTTEEACLLSSLPEVCVDGDIGWYCPKRSEEPIHVYKGCTTHSITVSFNGGDHSCLIGDGNFELFAKVDEITASVVSVSAINDSTTCCSVTIEFIVTDAETFDIQLTAGLISPFKSYVCKCENYSIVHDEILPVNNIKAYTECNTVTVSWNGPADYTYMVSIPELNIYNRSTEIAEITFDLDQEGIQVNTSYTVIVQPSVCGRYGNSSSAVITIAMEPQMSDEVMHAAFSSTNDSYGTTVLMAKVALPGCPAAYPNEVLLNFTCDNDIHKVSLPVIVHEDGTILMEFELPRKRCDGIMTWQNKYNKEFDQLITIVTAKSNVIETDVQQLNTNLKITFSYFITCCFITANMSHHNVQYESFCQLHGRTFTGINLCTTAFHECDNDYIMMDHNYNIHPATPSHSVPPITGSTSSSQTTTSSTTCTTTITPEPSNESHNKVCLNVSAFSMVVVLPSIFFVIGFGIVILLLKCIIPRLKCRGRQSKPFPDHPSDDQEPERIINSNSHRTSSSSAPILVSYEGIDPHTEQNTLPSLDPNQPPVINDGTRSNTDSSSHTARPLLPPQDRRGPRYSKEGQGPSSVV